MSTTIRSVDPAKPGKYPVFLGESLQGNDSARPVLTGVKYNHKPNQTSSRRKTRLRPVTSNGSKYVLSIADNDEKSSAYKYTGNQTAKDGMSSCALVYDPSRQAFVLERVSEDYQFNLTSAPWETDASKLRQTYPQMETGHDGPAVEAEIHYDESDDGSEAEESNPYDFRHFMSADGDASPDRSMERSPIRQRLTPSRSPGPENGSSLNRGRGSPTARTPSRTSQQGARRGRRSPEADDDADDESSGGNSDEDGGLVIDMGDGAPEKPSRQARGLGIGLTPRHHYGNEDSDVEDQDDADNGLTIEMDDSLPKRSLAAVLPGRLTPGRPISLRSASSVSPPRETQMQEQPESDVIAENERPNHSKKESQGKSQELDDDELKLPSPLGQRDESDLDLAAELTQALESEAAGVQKQASESESEEE